MALVNVTVVFPLESYCLGFTLYVKSADPFYMKTIIHDGHRIEAPGSTLTGKEIVRYDGAIVSSKRSILGATHTFEVDEKGEPVQYEIAIGTRWHGFSATCTILRNGELLFTDC